MISPPLVPCQCLALALWLQVQLLRGIGFPSVEARRRERL